MDELPEFSRASIEVLRQPMEDGYITISRVGHSFEYPSDTMYVAAMNPCRCGFYPDMQKCRCTSADIHNYLGKLSEPLLDRLDICVEASLPEFRPKNNASEDSATIRNRVEKVYKIQNERYVEESFLYNSQVPESLLDKYCYLGEKEMDYLEKFYQSEGCSMRQISRIRRVARTIADMDSSDVIMRKHLSEAILFRSINKRYWR